MLVLTAVVMLGSHFHAPYTDFVQFQAYKAQAIAASNLRTAARQHRLRELYARLDQKCQEIEERRAWDELVRSLLENREPPKAPAKPND